MASKNVEMLRSVHESWMLCALSIKPSEEAARGVLSELNRFRLGSHCKKRSCAKTLLLMLIDISNGWYPAALTNKGKPLVQVVSPTAPKRGARDRFSRQQGRNGEYAQAHSERASIIATLRTGSREARNGTEMQSSRREKYCGHRGAYKVSDFRSQRVVSTRAPGCHRPVLTGRARRTLGVMTPSLELRLKSLRRL